MMDRLTSLFDESGLEAELLRLVDGSGSGVVGLVAIVMAAAIGAVHAIGPGHGKVLIGAYLASTRGRRRDALALGGLVALMHTASVLALGVFLQLAQRVPNLTWVEQALALTSAAAVTVVGILLVTRQRHRGRAPGGLVAAPEAPQGGHHDHSFAGSHASHGELHVHRHDHRLPEGVPPLSRAGVVGIATSGGLLPSPAAFLVLATAMALDRTGFGITLVAAFGVGLGLTLTLVGLAVLWGRGRLEANVPRAAWVRWLGRVVPRIAAWSVVVGGLVLAAAAIARL